MCINCENIVLNIFHKVYNYVKYIDIKEVMNMIFQRAVVWCKTV